MIHRNLSSCRPIGISRRQFLYRTGIGAAGSLGCLLLHKQAARAASAPHVHDASVLVAAQVSPEPFRSNWQSCRGGSWPDYMRDQPLGHANQRAAGLLYTLEAIRYLRENQINKALLLASARCHYVVDSSCIAHAYVWKPRRKEDVLQRGKPGAGVWSFLPEGVQDYWLPFGKQKPQGYHPLLIDSPPVFKPAWKSLVKRKLEGSMHAFFDQTHPLEPYPEGFPATGLPDTANWSSYDREFYGRWVAENVALKVLDRKSVLAGRKPVRFAGKTDFQKALEAEMRNMIASVAAYYRYLSVARETRLVGDIEALLPSIDRLALLARVKPKIYLSDKAPWPLKRACRLLAMEIVRAEYRNRGLLGGQYGYGLREKTDLLFDAIPMSGRESEQRVVISWKEGRAAVNLQAVRALADTIIVCERGESEGGHIVLRGKDLQSTLHLVDYMLDLTLAPLHGRAPMEVLLTVLRRQWEGVRLMEELRTLSDKEAATKPARPRNPHVHDQESWGKYVRRMLHPFTEGQSDISGPLQIFWNLLLKDLPLPDGNILI